MNNFTYGSSTVIRYIYKTSCQHASAFSGSPHDAVSICLVFEDCYALFWKVHIVTTVLQYFIKHTALYSKIKENSLKFVKPQRKLAIAENMKELLPVARRLTIQEGIPYTIM